MSSPSEATGWIWRNGEFISWADATIHVISHVVHYGSSVFEGIRCYSTPDGPSIFRLPEHLRRLRDSATLYRMECRFSNEELTAACCGIVVRNGLEECYIRPILLRGVGARGVNPLGSPVESYIICWPWGAYLGDGALERGVDVCISSWQRPGPNTHPVLAKAGGNYLSSQLIHMEAVANGFHEGLALGPGGLVSEGSGQNIFLVRRGRLITPALDGTLLEGITRDCVITIARDLGLDVVEQPVPRELLYAADEAFFTGTASEITPIRSVDRIMVGGGVAGPVTRRLQQQLLALAGGRVPDAYGWRTPVLEPEEKAAVA